MHKHEARYLPSTGWQRLAEQPALGTHLAGQRLVPLADGTGTRLAPGVSRPAAQHAGGKVNQQCTEFRGSATIAVCVRVKGDQCP